MPERSRALSLTWPDLASPPADLSATIQRLGPALDARAGRPLPGSWLLAGLTTSRRLRVDGALAAAWRCSRPDDPLERAVRRPDRLATTWRGLDRERSGGALLDLTVIADGASAATGEPVALNLLLAGRDLVSVDAVAARLLGIDPRSAPLVRAAAASGWGEARLDDVTIVGDHAADLPAVRSCLANVAAGGWGPEDWPTWLAGLWRLWQVRGMPARRRRRRFQDLPWARLRANPTAPDPEPKGRP
jgi:hypothetical protein